MDRAILKEQDKGLDHLCDQMRRTRLNYCLRTWMDEQNVLTIFWFVGKVYNKKQSHRTSNGPVSKETWKHCEYSCAIVSMQRFLTLTLMLSYQVYKRVNLSEPMPNNHATSKKINRIENYLLWTGYSILASTNSYVASWHFECRKSKDANRVKRTNVVLMHLHDIFAINIIFVLHSMLDYDKCHYVLNVDWEAPAYVFVAIQLSVVCACSLS